MKKPLSHYQWVKQAVVDDETRPVLMAVNVHENTLTATNGHILFHAPRSNDIGVPDGLWRGTELIEGTFPNWEKVIPEFKKDSKPWSGHGYYDIIALCEGQIAAAKSAGELPQYFPVLLPVGPETSVALQPTYPAKILQGMTPTVRWFGAGPLSPVCLRDGDRMAIIMAVRISIDDGHKHSQPWRTRDLRELCSPSTRPWEWKQ